VSRWAARLWLFAAFLCALAFAPAGASADPGSPPSAAIVPGTAAGWAAVSAAPPSRAAHEVVGRELPEWVDRRTGSASRLSSSCGRIIEAHLSGTPRHNYLDLTLQNDSETKSDFQLSGVTAHFGSGLTRQLNPSAEHNRAASGSRGHWTHRAFSFPSKAEFEHEDRLRIEVSIEVRDHGVCSASIELVRRSDIEVPERSYTAYSPGGMSMGLTMHFAASGDLRTIASNVNPGFDLGWFAFPWVHHGIGFEFGVDAYGSRGLPAAVPAGNSNAIIGGFAMVTYSYRIQLSQRFTPQWDLGLGYYGLSADSEEGNDRLASANCFSMREKLKLNILLSTSNDGSRVEVAPALIHSYIPAGDFGATSVSGNLFSGALYLVID